MAPSPKLPTPILFLILGALLSTTRLIIDRKKRSPTRRQSGDKLRHWNSGWFIFEALLAAALLLISPHYSVKNWCSCVIYTLCVIAFWRINEIAFAFYSDSMSKLKQEQSSSDLKPYERVQMLLKSYVGIIVQFAVLYYCLFPGKGFTEEFDDFRDALYFSATTLTAIGQEGQEVCSHWLRAFYDYESASGILLLVVAVSIYIDRANSSEA